MMLTLLLSPLIGADLGAQRANQLVGGRVGLGIWCGSGGHTLSVPHAGTVERQ